MKKIRHLLAGIAVAATAVWSGQAAAQAAPVDINFGYTTADHVTLYVAQDLGLFEKAGLKPKFFTFQSGAPLLAGLKSESLDVVTAGLGLAFALGQKIPLSVIYVNSNDATGEGLVVARNSPIKSYRDIGPNHKVGAASGTCAQVALNLMAKKNGVDFAKMNVVNLPAPLLRNAFLSNSIDAGIAWSPYSASLDAEGFKVVSWDPEYTPGGVCPRMTAARPDYLKKHPDVGVKLLEIESQAAEAVAKAAVDRVYMQRPSLAEQLDPASSHSMVSAEGGLVGKLNLAMQVLHTTKTIPEPIPLSVIQQAVDPQYLKRFAASRR